MTREHFSTRDDFYRLFVGDRTPQPDIPITWIVRMCIFFVGSAYLATRGGWAIVGAIGSAIVGAIMMWVATRQLIEYFEHRSRMSDHE